MQLDLDTCHQALQARDARFDGRFYVGVSSTGIYCRPVCPARTPKAANCDFFPHAAAAERTTTQQSERRDREGYPYPFECRDRDVLQLIKIRMCRDAQGSRRQ